MKRKTLFSVAGVSLLTATALPAQLAGQVAAATPAHSGGPSHYNLTDLGVVGPIPGQPFHIADNGLIAEARRSTTLSMPSSGTGA